MASHRIVHFEFPADRPEALARFYSELFGWKVEKTPLPGFDYWVCRTGEGPGIDGGIVKRMTPQHQTTNYVNVEQIEPVAARAQELGARMAMEKMAVPGAGWFCLLLDPDGNPFGLWQPDHNAR